MTNTISEDTQKPETTTTSEDTQVPKPTKKPKATQKPETIRLPLDSVCVDKSIQSREKLNENVILEYTEAMKDGAKFPDIVVFYDGSVYWLADGFHRFEAARRLKVEDTGAEVKEGTKRDAILYSACANSKHGLRRTNADKRKAVSILIKDEDWCKWSDRDIARKCGVSNTFVSELRSSLSTVDSENKTRAYVNKHGSVSIMSTANIGQQKNTPSQQVLDKEVPDSVDNIPEENDTPPVPAPAIVPDSVDSMPEENTPPVSVPVPTPVTSNYCDACGRRRGKHINIVDDMNEETHRPYGYLCMQCHRIVEECNDDYTQLHQVANYLEQTRK